MACGFWDWMDSVFNWLGEYASKDDWDAINKANDAWEDRDERHTCKIGFG